ncbi:MAG TPA: tetratricopeptide repeat protein [Pyrinomonadaceae bacterium]|jgi:tetratricopeptide (TPR) repeat protein/thioredoxin-like negative regulator of GroEL
MKKIKSTSNKYGYARMNIGKNLRFLVLISPVFLCLIIFGFLFASDSSQNVFAEEAQTAIEKALYAREEFFGADAIMPLPTAQALENLAKLAQSEPDNPRILEKLAELEEKLSNFDAAEQALIHLTEIDGSKLENLAAFYHRRARFEKEAEILRKILITANPENRAEVFGKLIDLARRHDLKRFMQNDFYAQVARENAEIYEIFEQLIDNLTEEGNFAEALNFIRQAKAPFPERKSVLLEKEIDILLETNRAKEAESIYQAAFDPFWSQQEAGKFYEFLSNQDRLRAYGAELKQRLKQNPADFDAAIRYALYRNHDYYYGNDRIAAIISNLEKAKTNWTTEELVTVVRLLLRENEAEMASRFLYTLYLREDFKKTGELRARVLYQLFEMFSDAGNQKLPLTKGDLRFYEDIAKTDTSPGIATGILSLIFSDTNPKERLLEQENEATKYFNRAAAYKIFLAYKEEFPTSKELAQMYLDIVRLYTATKEPEIAVAALNEFEQRYERADDYPAAALKLADAFAAADKPEKQREIYQKLLNYLGKQGNLLKPKIADISKLSNESVLDNPFDSNAGISIPNQVESQKNYDYTYNYGEQANVFNDYLARKNQAITYADVLEKLVASLANEKKTAEILAVYSNEIQKYPDEEWLYEQRLAWLEQTNLIEDQLKIYQAALARFQSRSWQDKLARWFLRQNRQTDFAGFSQDLVGKLNDAELQNYLSQFVGEKTSATDFEKQLYLKLYTSARERFPHNPAFVNGLLRFHKINNRENEWRSLAAKYYFESKEIREQFLDDLSRKGELRDFLAKATGDGLIYELFRADAAVRLSNYEAAVEAYRKLNRLYPNTPEFLSRLISFTRSFGQKNREFLTEAAALSHSEADFLPSSAKAITQSGEVYAELGQYEKSREQWEKLISTASGEKEIYLETATVYWDYFQYEDALRTIKNLRSKQSDETLYAFEAGAILEAQHDKTKAIGEYVKALGSANDETQKRKSIKRLTVLAVKEPQIVTAIDSAFEAEKSKRKDSGFLSLGYAGFLIKIKQSEKAVCLLNQAVQQSADKEFIEAAREFYQSENNFSGEQRALKRLAEIVSSPRQTILYRLQLAKSFEENRDRNSAKAVLAELVRKFPTNYGVLTESADFYYRLGFENESVAVLHNALSQSRGYYRTALAEKLAKRLIQLNRLDSAEQILSALHNKDKANTEFFRQLAGVCVRTRKTETMRKAFGETVDALKQSDADRRELDEQIADLREQMIDAFTQVGDYKSAIEQHIEIINRQPDDEMLVENAISYAERYGGAETLLNFYLKTSADAFKNYRWNVVLARIYAARNDLENAAENYRAAIINQPEMSELYLAFADLETKRNNFDEAVKNLDKALELTNDAPEYVKRKIEILKKAGRFAEVEVEKAKLPVEERPKTTSDQFAEAQRLQYSEKEKAGELYREAFAKLFENPLYGDLKASDITGYVNSLREEEPLDQINQRLWQLREKLIEKADETDSTNAGEARKRRVILEGAMTEAVGNIAKTVGTDEELSRLHEDLQRLMEETSSANDRNQTISLIQNICRRAGFGDLEEAILLRKLKEAKFTTDAHFHLQNLVSFYNERGAYQKTFELLEEYKSENLALKAEAARLLNNREKELEALRAIYWKENKVFASSNSDVARYLEILYAENHEELKSLTEKSSSYQLQLINFLLGKGERKLAHAAIENANLPPAWKLSRRAETSLALKELGETAECFFCKALQLESIGMLVEQKPDKKRFLINDDWFRLSRKYGEWLFERRDQTVPPAKFLVSMIENQPRNAEEQFKLGSFYLEKNAPESAIEHFRLALEISPEDKTAWSAVGVAYHLAGKTDLAEECRSKALADDDVKSALVFFQILQKQDLAERAREKLPSIIIKFLQNNDADRSEDFQNLIRALAASFGDEREKSAYFLQILDKRPADKSLAGMLINESLIGKNRQNQFYELLIERSKGLSSYDYDYNFTSIAKRVWTSADAESVYDQENDYETEELENDRLEWQKKYLIYLVGQGENAKAEQLITKIEKDINGRYVRPEWLRLEKIRIQTRLGKFDLLEAERFIGISVSDSTTKINPPSLERFNEILQVLKEENSDGDKREIALSFFARMLALGQYNEANFIGFARALFDKGDIENALRMLQLMIAIGNGTQKESALAEIAAIDVVTSKGVDAAKLTQRETIDSINQVNALKIAAEVSAEFRLNDAAIAFRHQLLEANQDDSSNRIELARLLFAKGEKQEAVNLLTQIISSRNALRSARWEARWALLEMGGNIDIIDAKFDSRSQFYNGLVAENSGRGEAATEFFLNSLIAEKDAENSARNELIKLYALSNKPFAALKLAETLNDAKSDELLQTLSDASEKIGNYSKAIEFERSKAVINKERIDYLKQLDDMKNQKATDLTIDLENTRKL